MLPFTLPALPVLGRPDSARGAPGERGTPREVQRLPLGAPWGGFVSARF